MSFLAAMSMVQGMQTAGGSNGGLGGMGGLSGGMATSSATAESKSGPVTVGGPQFGPKSPDTTTLQYVALGAAALAVLIAAASKRGR